MSVPFSLSTGNEHYKKHTPQGSMLSNLLEIIPKTPDLWYCDTFSMPDFSTLKRHYQGTVILYCWWDPADERILPHIDDMDINFVIITSDHGSIRVEKPTMIKGDKDTSAGIRYKYGRNIYAPEKGGLTITKPEKYGLPRVSQFNQFIIAKNKHFFVYPNNYNKFVNRLKNSFQHGGISLEELIIPVTKLQGKNWK